MLGRDTEDITKTQKDYCVSGFRKRIDYYELKITDIKTLLRNCI